MYLLKEARELKSLSEHFTDDGQTCMTGCDLNCLEFYLRIIHAFLKFYKIKTRKVKHTCNKVEPDTKNTRKEMKPLG